MEDFTFWFYGKRKPFACPRMLQLEMMRAQRQRSFLFRPIFCIPRQRISRMGKLDADLVVAARSEVDLHQGSVLLCPYHFIFQHRFFRSGGAWLYDAGCVAPSVFYKEILKLLHALFFDFSLTDGEILFLHCPVLHLPSQFSCGVFVFRKHQHALNRLIEPVNDRQIWNLSPRLTRCFRPCLLRQIIQQRMLQIHKRVAESMGMHPNNIVVAENGSVIELTTKHIKCETSVPSGEVFVDGSGVGEVGAVVLNDRKLLAEDGMVVIVLPMSSHDHQLLCPPEIVTRGFVYVKESEELLDTLSRIATDTVDGMSAKKRRDDGDVCRAVRSAVSSYLYKTTKRSPMIIPMVTKL